MNGAPLFKAEGVTYRYGREVEVFSGLSLEIEAGRKVAVVGANGSGKSTLLKILGGILFPTHGRLLFEGRHLTEESASTASFRRHVAVVFQNPDSQLFNPTVWDELLFGPLQLGLSQEEAEEEARKNLEFFRLEALRDRHPYHLSGGEKKKALLAAVLCARPDVLILDEPTANLDPRSALELVDYLLELNHRGKTIVSATHDMHTLCDLADYLYVLSEDSELLAEGKTSEILENQELLERANLVHVHKHRHGAEWHVHRHSHDTTHEHNHQI